MNDIKELAVAAESGDPTAQFNLGRTYFNGMSVPRDFSLTIKWWSKAASQNDPRAQVNLGSMYTDGIGTQRDYAEALKWFEIAAAKGDKEAIKRKQELLERTPPKNISADEIAEAKRRVFAFSAQETIADQIATWGGSSARETSGETR